MRKNIVVMALVAVLCLVGPAVQAVTVTLDMRDNGDGTYDLYASSSTGDNFGIAYFNIDLVNILTATHQSPTDFALGGTGTVGFAGARANLTAPGALFAYQDTSANNADKILYGVGQTAGTYAGGVAPVGIPWTAPVLLASGTYSGAAPGFGAEKVVNVFTQEWADGDPPSGIVAPADSVVLIPEPATMVMLALGAGLMVALRRRR